MFAVATASGTVCLEFYLYLHDSCVSSVCFVVCFYMFYVYMGQGPEIKLMMMIITIQYNIPVGYYNRRRTAAKVTYRYNLVSP